MSSEVVPLSASADHLVATWIDLIATATGGRASPAAASDAGVELVGRWRQAHRRYHGVGHLAEVLSWIDALQAGDDVAVRLAGWFHDAVYTATPGADEEASAQLADDVLTDLGVVRAVIDETVRLVRVTATHDPAEGDVHANIVCDADFAVLARAPHEYASYVAQVRDEYSHVDDAAFDAGRAALLRSWLARDFVYRTPLGRERLEQPARRNLRSELASLQAAGTSQAGST